MRLIIIIFLLITGLYSQAQYSVDIKVTGGDDNVPIVANVSVKGTAETFSTDSTGTGKIIFPSGGKFIIVVSAAGFRQHEISIDAPVASGVIEITLEHDDEELEEVIIQSTRISRTIANVPTRIETIELEEIDEKSNMRPANVAMILHESTGIQVQQTSATSGNASIRIQGLDGRYTQLLKDGFPNYGNFSSGLSVLEIPPLDLKQVEIIKGPASPLFGGGAIAGVINFISRTPKETPEYNFIINHSNIGQTNIGGFISGKGKSAGYTLLALYNKQKEYDVDNDEFTEVPRSYEFSIHPKLFLYAGENTTIIVGNSFSKAERTGGDIRVIKSKADLFHTYFEKNTTLRNISTVELNKKIGANRSFTARQSFSVFDRTITIPSYNFAGVDYNAFSDVSYVSNLHNHAVLIGANFIYNSFDEKNNSSGKHDNRSTTTGVYAQHTLDASNKVKLESGLRIDAVSYSNSSYRNNEIFVLPRVSLLVKYSSSLSSRLSAGMGYKTPTLFTEETETIQYQNLGQLNNVRSEKSYGGTADLNLRTRFSSDLSFSLNHMFFYTQINNPLILFTNASGDHSFVNASGRVQSLGFETNAKFIYRDNFKLFLGYTFTDAKAKYLPGNAFLPLVPRSKLNTALIYEKEDVIKLGLEGYFTGRQYLTDGSRTPTFSELGFMAEKIFKKFSVFLNLENFTDTRQGKYKNVVNGPHTNPTFDEIWTHTEGFVFNGGVKLKL